MTGQLIMGLCECSDTGCSGHPPLRHNRFNRCYVDAAVVVFRSDMEDQTGTAMCGVCAADALDSGVFYTKEEA